MTCCDEITLDLFRQGLLDPGKARSIAEHLENCPACQQLTEALDQEDDLLMGALRLSGEELASLQAADLPGQIVKQVRGFRRWERLLGAAGLLIASGAMAGFFGVVQPFLERWGLLGPAACHPVAAALSRYLFDTLHRRWFAGQAGGQNSLLIPLLLLGLTVMLLNVRSPRRPVHHQ